MTPVRTERRRQPIQARWYSPRRAAFWVMAPVMAPVMVWLLVGFLILPGLVRTAAEDVAAEAFGLDLEIETVRTNPITLSLALTGLHATTPDGATAARAERVALALHPLSAVTRPWSMRPGTVHGVRLYAPGNGDERPDAEPGLSIDTVELVGGRYRAREHDLRFDSVALNRPRLRLHAGQSWPWRTLEPHAEAVRSLLPRVDIARLRAVDLDIGIVDERLHPPASLRLGAINLNLADVSSAAYTTSPLRVEGAFDEGGGFSLDGALTLAPDPQVTGEIEIDGFALPRLAEWIPDLDIIGGRLFAGGDLEIRARDPLAFRGRVDIDDLHLAALEDPAAALRWRRLYAEHLALSLGHPRLEVGMITLDTPETRLRFTPDGAVHAGPLRIPARPDRDTPQMLPSSATVIIGGLRVTDGHLELIDPAGNPSPLHVRLHGLKGELSRLSTSASQPARLTLTGNQTQADRRSRIHGRIRLPARLREAEAQLTVHAPGIHPSTAPGPQAACYRIDATGFTAACNWRRPRR